MTVESFINSRILAQPAVSEAVIRAVRAEMRYTNGEEKAGPRLRNQFFKGLPGAGKSWGLKAMRDALVNFAGYEAIVDISPATTWAEFRDAFGQAIHAGKRVVVTVCEAATISAKIRQALRTLCDTDRDTFSFEAHCGEEYLTVEYDASNVIFLFAAAKPLADEQDVRRYGSGGIITVGALDPASLPQIFAKAREVLHAPAMDADVLEYLLGRIPPLTDYVFSVAAAAKTFAEGAPKLTMERAKALAKDRGLWPEGVSTEGKKVLEFLATLDARGKRVPRKVGEISACISGAANANATSVIAALNAQLGMAVIGDTKRTIGPDGVNWLRRLADKQAASKPQAIVAKPVAKPSKAKIIAVPEITKSKTQHPLVESALTREQKHAEIAAMNKGAKSLAA